MSTDDLLDNLTDAQREAVMHTDGPLLVLAGAGSGKTRVITRRAVHIARTVARPEQVLAITFTNKAAGEMRERIWGLGVEGRMWVCTFHSLCARLLRDYAEAAGLSRNYTIVDQSDRRSLLRDATLGCGLDAAHWPPRMIEVRISDAKNRLVGPEEFETLAHDYATKTIARVYHQYQRMLSEQQACDFDDLLMRVANLLQQDEMVCAEMSARFRYLLIDEYQDTNHAQYIIASRLASSHRNICATGDPDQSIYAWRGADLRNILDFEADYPETRVVRLEQNFRSTGAILSSASALIANNAHRKHKELWTSGEKGMAVRIWTCDDEMLEASRIAEDIAQKISDGAEPGDFAIFYRINALSRVVEDALRARHLPYQIARGIEFYGRKEIKDVLAYLRTIQNPADETALFRAMCAPSRGIGKTTIEKIKSESQRLGGDLEGAMRKIIEGKGAAVKKVGHFVELLSRLRTLPRQPVQPVVEAVLKESGLEASLADAGDIDNEPLANVYELVNAAKQFDADNPDGTLEDWLQQVSLVSDADSLAEGGAVTLMTLHTAKGLEYPNVFIVGLEERLLPHQRALQGDQNELEEERRLCFVGMTRAMQLLTLSHAKYRMVRGITERTVASRFLSELPQEEVARSVFETHRDRSASHLGRFDDTIRRFGGEYYPGQRVRHEEYGEGEVVGLEPRGRSLYVRIYFGDYGERAFACEHVSLYVMD